MTPSNAELPNFNACRKHQDTEVYGEYGQRGCEDCVFTAKLIQAREQQMITEILGELPPTDYEGRDYLGGFNDARRQFGEAIEKYREEL